MAQRSHDLSLAVSSLAGRAAKTVRSSLRAMVRLGSSRHPSGVIVADDDPFMRAALRANLEQIDQDVFLADDGEEAVRLASEMRAALVILDIRMPKLDGLHACSRIRQLPGYAATPIVMLTVDDTERSQRTASRAGATMFLAKPFASASLMLALSRFLPIGDATLETIHSAAVRATGGKVFRKMHS